jgi:hypothetical protein
MRNVRPVDSNQVPPTKHPTVTLTDVASLADLKEFAKKLFYWMDFLSTRPKTKLDNWALIFFPDILLNALWSFHVKSMSSENLM